jgi:3-dehydroquinate dehydratase-2
LNLLGTREPAVYGSASLAEIEQALRARAQRAGVSIDWLQSNSELALIERIHAARNDGTALILMNPGAFTHTSVALRDALAAVSIPYIELHLSNVFAREEFRRHSFLSDRAIGVISGFGPQSYELAFTAALSRLGAAATH